MMKNVPAIGFLAGLLLVAGLLTAWQSVRYYFAVREQQTIQSKFLTLNRTMTAVQSLANEAVEYSRGNPAIDPILEEFKLKQKAPPATALPVKPPLTQP